MQYKRISDVNKCNICAKCHVTSSIHILYTKSLTNHKSNRKPKPVYTVHKEIRISDLSPQA